METISLNKAKNIGMVFSDKSKAGKAAENVQEYLNEQEMYLSCAPVEIGDGKFIVAIVNCY